MDHEYHFQNKRTQTKKVSAKMKSSKKIKGSSVAFRSYLPKKIKSAWKKMKRAWTRTSQKLDSLLKFSSDIIHCCYLTMNLTNEAKRYIKPNSRAKREIDQIQLATKHDCGRGQSFIFQ